MNMYQYFLCLLLCFFLIFPAQAKTKHQKKHQKQKQQQIQSQTTSLKLDFSVDEPSSILTPPPIANNLIRLKGLVSPTVFECAQQLALGVEAVNQRQFDQAKQILEPLTCPPIDDYRTFDLATALAHLGQYAEALKVLPATTMIKTKIDRDRFWLRIKILIFSQASTQQIEQEVRVYQNLKVKDPSTDLLINYHLGLAHTVLGERLKAYPYFAQVYVNRAGSEFDEKIIRVLSATSDSVQSFMTEGLWLQRAANLQAKGLTAEAQTIVEQFFQKKPQQYLSSLADITFDARDYPRAAQLYEKILNDTKAADQRLEVLIKLSQSYTRSDQFDKAIEINRNIANTYAGTSDTDEAAFKVAFLTFDAGRYDQVPAVFEPFLTDKNKSRQVFAYWYRAWAFYLTQKYQEAVSEWSTLETLTLSKDMRSRILYWKARAFEKMGDSKQASAFYRLSADADPTDYESLLAKQRLMHKQLESQVLVKPGVVDFGIPAFFDPPDLASIPETDPLMRAILLSHIGLGQYSYNEVLNSPLKDSADIGLLNLADYYMGQDYPRAYATQVESVSKSQDIQKSLIWAVMRQESRFRPDVISPADAMGLMQIIPSTAQEIAMQLGVRDFDPSLLTQPALNIYFGSFYLSSLNKKFNNNPIPTIAAYNAGPEPVQRWINKKGNLEWDEWIELIPYKETREYVKRVLVNEWVYEKGAN